MTLMTCIASSALSLTALSERGAIRGGAKVDASCGRLRPREG